MRHTPSSSHKGFTLLEMTMVIAIISLIIGSIMVGQSMTRASKLQSVISEVAQYTQAIISFRTKYQALPGDFTGATALWGAASGGCPGGAGTGTQTCDGNGDGRITTQASDSNSLPSCQYEQFRAWQHLANAGFITGTYSGVAGASDPQQAIIGTNVPASQLPSSGYTLTSLMGSETMNSALETFPSINYLHMLQLGATSATFGDYATVAPVLTTAEAQALDSKIDDGYPSSGSVVALNAPSSFGTCAVQINPSSHLFSMYAPWQYNTSSSGPQCSLAFLLGF